MTIQAAISSTSSDNADELPFQTLPDLIREYAANRPEHPALIQSEQVLTYAQLNAQMDRVAASLQRDGVGP
ncbi:MAG: AMP-binding protein, partial [Herbaspirillum sp.]